MDTEEIRAYRVGKLRELIKNNHKRQSDFARRYDIHPTYVSQLLNGHRSFGEKSARKLERQIGLPLFYFDGVDEESLSDITESELIEALKRALPKMSEDGKKTLIKLCSDHL